MSDEAPRSGFEEGYTCPKCGHMYGKTNLSYKGCDIYLMCKCGAPETDDTLYIIDTQNIEVPEAGKE